MKKALFVLGFALCATFAMAQTNRVDKTCQLGQTNKAAVQSSVIEQPVDYKASIFTKDDDVVLASFDFAAGTMPSTNYGSTCKVQTGDVIDGAAVAAADAHGRSEAVSYWVYVPDSATFVNPTGTFATEYTGVFSRRSFICRYMGARNGVVDGSGNGFMLISLSEFHGNNQAVNAYFTLPTSVDLQGNSLIDVMWKQAYAKYYDQCFIDYKVGNNWHSIEVNVEGIDVDINGATGYGYRVATLPPAAIAGQTSIDLRFRSYADGTLYDYGYFWAVDDVKVVAPAASARWSFSNRGYLNGFFGTLPQGFNIPISYVMSVRNRGTENLTNVNMHLYHVGETNPVMTRAQSNIPAGDPAEFFTLRFNESGFMDPTHGFTSWDTGYWYQSVPSNYTHYGATDAALEAAGFGRVGLPTTTTGKNQFAISVTANGTTTANLTRMLDTMAYTVSGYMDVESSFGRTVPGYRWSSDNGVVPGGSEWSYQFSTGSTPENSGYVTTTGVHQYDKEYQMYTRFNTPNVIPTDANGQPWVIRGVEYVTATTLTSDQVNGTQITPFLMMMAPDASGSLGFADVNTGLAGDEHITVGPESAVATPEDNYTYYTPDMDQHVVNVLFPEQPELVPNMMYIMGYINAEGGPFALAGTAYSYQNTDSTSVSYLNEPDLADYYLQTTPSNKVYDAWAYDPTQGSRNNPDNHTIFGYNIDNYPMVRLIVGPKMTIPTYEVYLDCGNVEDGEDTNYWVFRNGIGVMNGIRDVVSEGSSPSYYFIPGIQDEMDQTTDDGEYYIATEELAPHMVIDAIVIDGEDGSHEVITDFENDDRIGMVDYTVYWEGHTPGDGADQWEPALVRNYYSVVLRNVHQNYTLSAQTSYHTLGISNVEDFINMSLAPNPATSQVRVNVTGFAGKADCSIIDMSGRVVYSTEINAGENVISLNNVPAGAYFVRVTSDTFSKVEKLIVR